MVNTTEKPKIVMRTRVIFAWICWSISQPAWASPPADPLIEGARQCTQYFPVEEKRHHIPTHLLAAISTTESGRWHKGLGMAVPWPWTINVEGKGYYFDSKAEAIARTQSLLAQGIQSIDVGCMQVNLKHHPKAFANLNQAFDPSRNVAYAATFLRDNYATLGDWIKATAAYHSRTSVLGERYLVNIERSWNKIVGKVAAARGAAPVQNAQASVMQAAPTPASEPLRAANHEAPAVKITSEKTMHPIASVRQARVIRVNDAMRRQSEVMVVRASPSKSMDASQAEGAIATADAESLPVGDSVRRVSLDSGGATSKTSSDTTKFVFTN